jgi:glutamyl-tRNA synthetase
MTAVLECISSRYCFHIKSHEEAKKPGAPLIQWVLAKNGIPCEVIMPDATTPRDVGEETFGRLKLNDIIEFERFGFVRADSED